jgi:hypothetical protein
MLSSNHANQLVMPLVVPFEVQNFTSQPLNDSILDMEWSSFGFLSHIPENFSFSYLKEGFNQSEGTFKGLSFFLGFLFQFLFL